MKVVGICGRGLGYSLILKFTLRDILKGLNRSDLKASFANPKSFKAKNVYVVVCDSRVSDRVNFDRKIVMDNPFNKRELEEKLTAFISENDAQIRSQT